MRKYNNIPVLLFEDHLPKFIESDQHSNLSLSNKYVKFGNESLRWDFGENSKITVTTKIGYESFDGNDRDQSRDTFIIWIYNEKPIKDHLSFKFGRKQKVDEDCCFDFGLNYEGWRCCWIMYDRDMKGEPHPDMDQLQIIGPTTVISHTLYINKIILSAPLDPRTHTADYQVPFVNLDQGKGSGQKWMSIYDYSIAERQAEFMGEHSKAEIKGIETIISRFETYIMEEQKFGNEDLSTIKQHYESYGIERRNGKIRGRTLNFHFYFEIFDKFATKKYAKMFDSILLKEYQSFMLRVALLYKNCSKENEKKQLKEIFINLIDHLYDQGFADGSSLGTLHHLGYCFREFYKSIFLMRDVLKEEGILERTSRSMSWFSCLGRIFYEYTDRGSMDVFNTELQSILASILVKEENSVRVGMLKQLTKWLSYNIEPKPGLQGPIKVDGCGYHHCNFYPAYSLGGMQGLTPVIYFLSRTDFKLGEPEHELVKNLVMNYRLFCNKYEWLISVSARHPRGSGKHSRLFILPFKYLAMAGTPDGSQETDHDVAAAYMRLVDDENDNVVEKFKELGIKAEHDINGNWSLNYGALALHRREDWLVGVRGHSRYLWANETYKANNLYGRYISHGQIQIMGCGNPVNNRHSGFVQEGWDWNSWPGTTTVHLPIDMLKSDVKNLDEFSGYEEMLLSDETYVGGLNLQNDNGMFAMKLHEHPKYEGSHRARKSVFFFDNRVICLGTNIENENEQYPTRTTLFQNYIKEPEESMYIDCNEKITGLNYHQSLNSNKDIWMLDNKGNGYYLPANQKVTVIRSLQHSKAQDTTEDTEAPFAKAFIDHGNAPKNADYEYMILVKSSKEAIKNIRVKMLNTDTEVYTILQKDYNAHIVKDHETKITAYALFEACEDINKEWVASVDTPCMVMTKEIGNDLALSICDPDLRLYEGIDESQYDDKGNRKEVSVYSRTWCNNPSQMYTVTLKVKGDWVLNSQHNNCRIINLHAGVTTIEFDCIDAMKVEVNLKLNSN